MRANVASPRMRGWTRLAQLRVGDVVGFPVHAGMDPRRRLACTGPVWLPRARGDGPESRK